MARIRSLKPEFWDDRKLARSCSRDARMLYMGLWNQSDEHSRLNGDATWIKGRVFAFDDDLTPDVIVKLLDELEAAGRIRQYQSGGDPFIYLPKLSRHQRLESKVESRLPVPPRDDAESDVEPLDADLCAPHADESAPDADESALLYVAGSREQVAGSRGQGTRAKAARLPDQWNPDPELIEAMRAEGIPDHLARRELPKFRDHWAAQPDAKGVKADWRAVWRNWLRRTVEQNGATGPPPNGRASSKAQGWLDVDNDQPAIGGNP